MSVAWGTPTYVAADHAAGALAHTRRAGVAAAHVDGPELAASVADAIVDLQFITWNFGDSVAFEALIAASESLGDERWARFAHGWARSWATRSKPFVRLDCTAPGRAMVQLAVRYNDAQLLSATRELADYLMTRNTLKGVYETWDQSPLLAPYSEVALDARSKALLTAPPAGVFVDCLHFDPPFLVALGRATGVDDYVRAGVAQALGYIELLQIESGLFDHFVLRGETGSFGPGWGRGQGWAILGLLEVLDGIADFEGALPADARERISLSALSLLRAMLKLQREDGHWYAVVTEPDSGDEFSTAGFMAWAIKQAFEANVLEEDSDDGHAMADAMIRARNAVLRSLDVDGQLREVSAAVYASTEPSHYGRVPRGYVVPWGQGPALLALLAGVRS